LTAIDAQGDAQESENAEMAEQIEEAQEKLREAQNEANDKLREAQNEANDRLEDAENSNDNQSAMPGMPPGGATPPSGGGQPPLDFGSFDFGNIDFGGRSNFAGQGDFTLIGYSSTSAMSAFQSGDAKITGGTLFDFGQNQCVISADLAAYNEITVGATIALTNPSNTDETYKFKVSGLFKGENMSNQILTGYSQIGKLIARSQKDKVAVKDSFGADSDSTLRGNLSANYLFKSKTAYDAFVKAVTPKLPDSYTVESADAENYDTAVAPIKNLAKFAGILLLIILGIGVVVLIIINTFSIRERKYEIGVMTAIGIKKSKVALQFVTELLAIAVIALALGGAVGALTSVPVSNALLSSQVAASQQEDQKTQENFGMGRQLRENPQSASANISADYVKELDAKLDIGVVLQLIAIGLLLTIISSLFAVSTILRYDPLTILSRR
jgi:putative ABC transport system permease protein